MLIDAVQVNGEFQSSESSICLGTVPTTIEGGPSDATGRRPSTTAAGNEQSAFGEYLSISSDGAFMHAVYLPPFLIISIFPCFRLLLVSVAWESTRWLAWVVCPLTPTPFRGLPPVLSLWEEWEAWSGTRCTLI